ncbi:MAG: ankyrin repeat domain-containing protein [Synergistaceae bacterium]|nr:ankyrin repeat domain-containing protein [Synergistaceae bacterium]
MLKRLSLIFVMCLFILIVLFSSSTTSNAWENEFNKFTNSILPIAANIASHQKPVLQDSQEIDEEDQQEFDYPPVVYGKLWQDNKNCIAYNYESAWKGAFLCYFETSDPSLVFTEGLKVGSSLKQVEKFFGRKGDNLYGNEVFDLQFDAQTLCFKIDKGKVTKIYYACFEIGGGLPGKIFDIVKSRLNIVQKSAKNANALAKPSFSENGFIIGNKVNVRTKPNTKSKVITQLNAKHPIYAFEKNGDWYHINTANGIEGWVFGEYVALAGEASKTANKTTSQPTQIKKKTNDTRLNDDLFEAIKEGKASTITSLVKMGADPNVFSLLYETPLSYAVRANGAKVDVVKALINAGADVNYRTPLKKAMDDMPGFFSDYQPNPEVIKTLIEAGADVNAKNDSGETVLMYAAANTDSFKAIKVLIDSGADINAKDKLGKNVLMYAGQELDSSREFITFLINSGIDVNSKDKYGATALMHAAYHRSLNGVKNLLEKGADVSLKDKDGYTALMYAVRERLAADKLDSIVADIIKVLVKAGADVSEKNKFGENALDLTSEKMPKTRKAIIEAVK